MMRTQSLTSAAAVLCGCAGTALAGTSTVTSSPVGPVNATIVALNFDESGGIVNGFLVGSNVLLTFPKRVCGGVGTLGAVGNSVTYSGTSTAYASGFQVVRASSYTNGAITYTPATRTPSSVYPTTAGTITQLNRSALDGSIDGLVFTPTSGDKVFVSFHRLSPALAALLTQGASISVAGTLEPAEPCQPAGTIAEVEAATLTVGGTTYRVGSWGH